MKKIIFVFSISIGFLSCDVKVKSEDHSAPKNEVSPKEIPTRFANAKDPICDMDVANDYTDTVVIDGRVYGFCSATCQKEFMKESQKYIGK